MPFSLKNHPFAVDAHFDYSLVLTYAFPKAQLHSLLPPCLELDTFQNEWAFVAVALVQTNDLRPTGFPRFLGTDFFLIGYRIFVRYHTSAGKRLRGLYILKSETDSRLMTQLGSVFTRYQYDLIDVQSDNSGAGVQVRSERAGLRIDVATTTAEVPLPEGSPFASWAEARRFAGPLPFTFSYEPTTRKVLIVQGMREHWQPTPVQVQQHEVAFLRQPALENPTLASAFLVRDIPYHWQRGRVDTWIP